MDSIVKQRFKLLLKELGISQQRFEISIKVGNGYISNISKGIGADVLLRILRQYPTINPYWLIDGEGSMFIETSGGNDAKQQTTPTPNSNQKTPLDVLTKQLEEKDRQIGRLIDLLERNG